MKVIVQIDATTPEGKEIIDYLKQFPEVVAFEDNLLHEPQEEYTTVKASTANDFAPPANYIPIEEFRVEAKKRAIAFLERNGIHS
ncbi:MAG TPA: hypothetical protein DDZ96_05680 [Porphyromonadaceae bacterium]|jgi:hypothetical protein|nr:hypothetical protein [Porphyromonadaceae bacterium]HBX19418.1 hypothetical protein [Porphyromonadaceae bacterium]HBX45253.1 hypothetical protein [Porphyromonadaceae bacterium]HCM22542.1 hypothetical protein [Porphyromonadaceae bacterium]